MKTKSWTTLDPTCGLQAASLCLPTKYANWITCLNDQLLMIAKDFNDYLLICFLMIEIDFVSAVGRIIVDHTINEYRDSQSFVFFF